MSTVIDCPSCHRQNNIDRPRCMYCGASLGGPTTASSPELPALLSADLSYLDYLGAHEGQLTIYAGPYVSAEGRRGGRTGGESPSWPRPLWGTLKHLTGWDDYTLRQRLLSELPFAVRGELTRDQARPMLKKLQSEEMPASVLAPAEILAFPPKEIAEVIDLQEEALLLADAQRQSWNVLPLEDIFLLVYGKLRATLSYTKAKDYSHHQEGGNRGASPPNTTETSRGVSQKDSLVLDVYRLSTPEAVRIHSRQTDLSAFGDPRTTYKQTIFHTMMSRLQKGASHALWDRRFRSPNHLYQEMPSSFQRQYKAKEFSTMTGGGARLEDSSFEDNFADFEYYSRLIALHLNRLWYASQRQAA